jgi:hypothetical protein
MCLHARVAACCVQGLSDHRCARVHHTQPTWQGFHEHKPRSCTGMTSLYIRINLRHGPAADVELVSPMVKSAGDSRSRCRKRQGA